MVLGKMRILLREFIGEKSAPGQTFFNDEPLAIKEGNEITPSNFEKPSLPPPNIMAKKEFIFRAKARESKLAASIMKV